MGDRRRASRSNPVRESVNRLLHEALGAEPCDTACTHVVEGEWTALGVANVVGRAAQPGVVDNMVISPPSPPERVVFVPVVDNRGGGGMRA